VLTGYGNIGDRGECRELGAIDYSPNPPDADEW